MSHSHTDSVEKGFLCHWFFFFFLAFENVVGIINLHTSS